MSKDLWFDAHMKAIDEAMEADPGLSWDDAYNSVTVGIRADELYRDHYAAMIDAARDRAKYEGYK